MKKVCVFILLVMMMSISSFAVSTELFSKGLEQFDTDKIIRAVPPQAEELSQYILKDLTFSEMLKLSPSQLYSAVKASVTLAIGDASRALLSIVSAVLLCAFLSSITQKQQMSSVFSVVAVLCITASLAVPLTDCVRDVARSVFEASYFMLSYVPVFSTIITAGGQPASAAAYAMTVMAASQFTSQLASQLLIPLCGVYLALCIAGALSQNPGILMLSGAIKKFAVWTLTLSMTLFVGILTLQSFMASAADTATTKTTKFLVGTFVPVVGGAIADALSSAQGCVRLIKATVGSFGIFVAALTFLPIVMRVVILKLVVNMSQAAGEVMGVSEVSPILSSFANALTVLLAILLSMCLLIIISTAVMLLVGGVV